VPGFEGDAVDPDLIERVTPDAAAGKCWATLNGDDTPVLVDVDAATFFGRIAAARRGRDGIPALDVAPSPMSGLGDEVLPLLGLMAMRARCAQPLDPRAGVPDDDDDDDDDLPALLGGTGGDDDGQA